MTPQTELEEAVRHANKGQEDRLNTAAAQADLFPPKPRKIVKMGTQHWAILEYLKTGKSLTPLEALRVAGTMKLSSRIGELEDMGYKFHSEWITTDTEKRVKRYWL